MSQANLSETLFKPRFKHPETSTLVRRFSAGKPQAMQSALSGNHVDHWYRLINRFDAPRDKCAHSREINGIAAAFQYSQKNYNPTASSYL
ncbi:alpha/beta hydrolase [Klebsiella sp. K4-154]|uniref:alpha/beta hydrolase n=1 Tax=Klebsiella sp. K4-154 TaxID=2920183 RepID=UPI0024DE0DBE|nr:alpha/beta hydrolase [Klebsiella sp. K4-154]MDK1978286.1 alpha/beta hydrolase [Klebsiella sp. K4-154]